ncbi:Tetratricopeptide repeat-containing protein [Catalinimonas alkaloidigena]|uniref:Tetratricopeptide repeat-containing protein n=1 Tax=Catalinimonas alkaloidigena TaxID=1075417 RepID=A0A1G9JDX7_9BACT|nr:hypothetical protein [Catalinimonas alkaloidigena]SDL35324.1 Tetratricopeptide repeat-containing protein [Catalinimonas alkaloidigena]
MASEKQQALAYLFAQLRATEDHRIARQLENKIWCWWMQSGDDALDQTLMRGFVAMSEGALTEAIRLFTEVIETLPDFAEGWNKRATAYYLRGDYKASVDDIQKTLVLEPRHFGALSGWATICAHLGDDEGTLYALEKLLEIYPHQPSVVDEIRAIHRRLGR